MNLGIDFGSTYSSFATVNTTSGLIELCKPTHSESEAVPSVVCVKKGQYETGHNARAQVIAKKKVVVYDAFKMLLTETNEEVLEKRGYDKEKHTPQFMAEKFLDQQINYILSNRSEEAIDNLVICVPEVWTTKESAGRGLLNGRNVIKEICGRIPCVKEVQVVSEPAAASAYFANHYRNLTGNQMSGHVLVVDYGGGTLDLTLTSVNTSNKDKSSVEIQVKHRAGVGENEAGKIGDAGIAYMEEVVRLALLDSPNVDINDPSELDPKSMDFRQAYNELERALKKQITPTKGIKSGNTEGMELFKAVSDCEDSLMQLMKNNKQFAVIEYGEDEDEAVVTFSHLYRAFKSVILKPLQTCLNTMKEFMEEAGIDYENSNNEQFHVVLVGGFCKFLLVQHYIKDFFDYSSTGDKRFEHDLGENREFAVAMGAALLAEKIITIKHTAPYAIGILSYVLDGSRGRVRVPNFAIQYRQEISADRDYWICDSAGPKKFINAKGSVSALLIGFDAKGNEQKKLVIKPGLANKIKNAYKELGKEYAVKFDSSEYGLEHNIGFNMDESEIVTLLIRAVKTNSIRRIPLDNFENMFELTET